MSLENIEYRKLLESPSASFDQRGTEGTEMPGGGKYWWVLLFIVAGAFIVIVSTHVKKEKTGFDTPDDRELFEKLPDNAKEVFIEKYGQPDEDDRECELYYLVAASTVKRPCIKCPVWCLDPGKAQILVSQGQIYYIGKTCRKRGEREKEHRQIIDALDLDYQRVKRGTEGYITTVEQLHLKTYFTKPEAIKEGCHLFLPPGNSVGMSQKDWKRLLEELR